MTLHLHRSNRIERLAQALASVAAEPLSDPLQRECIVVQGPGMERWLSAFLARELGVWANPWFPFPRALVELFLDALLGTPSEQASAFAPEGLTWSIAAQLPQLLSDPGFEEVAAYLAGDRHAERLLELARRLAENFDQYAVYRPELVLGWERGEGAHFQAKLFRALTAKLPAVHLAARIHAFEQALRSGAVLAPGLPSLPERVALFGISTLPPAFVHMFGRIAQQRDVHLFLLTPSREYWGDVDRSQRGRSDLHGFLGELGKVSREFLDLLEEQSYRDPGPDLFESRGHDTMLHALQSDLLDLTARSRTRAAMERPIAAAASDDSLRVHVCHSIVRELEVLRDQLRARFERDATLEARDVIVFTPDIERYAPAIEAVFGERGVRDERAIPFRVADRRAAKSSEVAAAFFALLDVVQSRLHLSEVLDLLHRECVRARFDIAESEVDRVQRWLSQSGARWAVDAAHRASFGQPEFLENSLRFALDRLLVGYAAPDGEQRELHGVLPHAAVEGLDALLLGKVARFLESLFAGVTQLAAAQQVGELVATASALLTALISSEGELGLEHHVLRSALAEMAAEAERAGFAAAIQVESLRKLLELRLERGRANVGFLAGGVTFCEPVPMRAIPFRVVCLLGMDDESFPRVLARPAFDLLAEQPRPGDRSLRDDDRQLFLEAVLSARDALHLSYVGKSAQDGSERPPSVLVDHLLRVCDQHFVATDARNTLALGFEGSVAERLRVEHALQRFDPRYFRGGSSSLFSYDEGAAQAARALLAPRRAAPAFVREPLPRLPAIDIDLATLQRFFRRPQELFLKERLALRLGGELAEATDREPIMLDALERFRVADELLELRQPLSRSDRERLLRGAGRLAPGSVGRAQFDELEALIDEVVAACPEGEPEPDRDFTLALPAGRLSGRIGCLTRELHVVRSVGTLHGKRLLSAFIEHVALCATGARPDTTLVVGRQNRREIERVTFSPVADAERLLDALLRLYGIGMCMPLPLFHDASELYARERQKGCDERTALARAQARLTRASAPGSGVFDDPHVMQVFGREQLLDLGALTASDGSDATDFGSVAELLFGNLLGHVESES